MMKKTGMSMDLAFASLLLLLLPRLVCCQGPGDGGFAVVSRDPYRDQQGQARPRGATGDSGGGGGTTLQILGGAPTDSPTTTTEEQGRGDSRFPEFLNLLTGETEADTEDTDDADDATPQDTPNITEAVNATGITESPSASENAAPLWNESDNATLSAGNSTTSDTPPTKSPAIIMDASTNNSSGNVTSTEEETQPALNNITTINITDMTTSTTILTEEETIVPTTALDNFVTLFEVNPNDGLEHIPFRFTYVFLIGGACHDPLLWYSRWVDAGLKTLQNVTQVICSEDDAPYTREFHLQALQQVVDTVGNKLNETLVLTVAVGLENDWTPVADLLRQGMAFFHAKEDPHNFDIEEYGLSPDNVLYFYFQWDERASAYNAGLELCRLHEGAEQLKIAKLYSHGRDGGLNYRVDEAVKAFKQVCGDTQLEELWAYEDDIVDTPQTIRALLTFRPIPDVVLTCHDETAAKFLKTAKEVLTDAKYSLVHTTGWDFIEKKLLNDRKILTTVDQVVLYPNRGLWKVIDTVVRLVEENGLRTTTQVQESLLLEGSLTISSDTQLVSCDQVGFLHADLLAGYNNGSPPSRQVHVSTGLLNVTILSMLPFEGKFQAVFWLKTSWADRRLEFDPVILNDTVPFDAETIWQPALFYRNEVEREDLYTSPATISFNGVVELVTHTLGTFLCPTDGNLRAFPFDIYNCAIELGAPPGIVLDHDFGFMLVDSDSDYDTSSSIDMDYNDPTVVYYRVTFERKPFTAYVRLILPAVLINFVGFMAFWIPEMPESVALGITSLLCSLAFRETVEIPETSDVTWTEVFMLINIFYQTSVLFIIWCSYSTGNRIAGALDSFFKRIHPKKATKVVDVYSTRKIITQSTSQLGKSTRHVFSQLGGQLSQYPLQQQSTLMLRGPEAASERQLPGFRRQNTLESDGGPNESHLMDIPESAVDPSSSHHWGDLDQRLAMGFSGFQQQQQEMEDDESFVRYASERLPRNSVMMSSMNGTSMAPPPPIPTRSSIAPHRTTSGGSTQGRIATSQPSFMSSSIRNSVVQPPQRPSLIKPKIASERKIRFTDVNIQMERSPSPKHFERIPSGGHGGDDYSQQSAGDEEGDSFTNVDWIGRWFIVPSYVIVMATLITTKWGFTNAT